MKKIIILGLFIGKMAFSMEQVSHATTSKTLVSASDFDLRSKTLADFHPQANLMIQTEVKGLPGQPFAPITSFNLMGRIFYFSRVFKAPAHSERDYVVMFSKNPTGLFVPRFIYRSRSDGSFRVSPEVYAGSRFSKGKEIHYTQETKLAEPIVAHIERSEEIPEHLYQFSSLEQYKELERALLPFFNLLCIYSADMLCDLKTGQKSPNTRVEKGVLSFDEETDIYKMSDPTLLKPFTDCPPGASFAGDNDAPIGRSPSEFYDYFRKLTYPKDFVPDFSRPVKVYSFFHTMLGLAVVQVFLGKLEGQIIEWHMAYDKEGRVWIDRIIFGNGQLNSYGIYRQVINSGLLTNKPLEHVTQAYYLTLSDENLAENDKIKPYLVGQENSYLVDITPLLDALHPIIRFRGATGIKRVNMPCGNW